MFKRNITRLIFLSQRRFSSQVSQASKPIKTNIFVEELNNLKSFTISGRLITFTTLTGFLSGIFLAGYKEHQYRNVLNSGHRYYPILGIYAGFLSPFLLYASPLYLTGLLGYYSSKLIFNREDKDENKDENKDEVILIKI